MKRDVNDASFERDLQYLLVVVFSALWLAFHISLYVRTENIERQYRRIH